MQPQRLDAFAVCVMLLLCSLWAVQQVASKVALSDGMPPVFQAVARSAISGTLLLAWLSARQGRAGLRRLFEHDGSLWPGLASGLLFAAEFTCLFIGLSLTTASRAVVLLYTSVLFTAAGAHWFIPGERLRPLHAAGLALAFAGVAVTLGRSGGAGSLLGDALVLGAAVTWGATTVLVKASPALGRAMPEKVLAYQLFGALPPLIVAAWVAGELPGLPAATPLAWASLVYQGVVVSFATYLAWFWLIARYPAGRLASFTFITPLLGVIAAWALLAEPFTPSLLTGVALVSAGVWLANR